MFVVLRVVFFSLCDAVVERVLIIAVDAAIMLTLLVRFSCCCCCCWCGCHCCCYFGSFGCCCAFAVAAVVGVGDVSLLAVVT